MVRQGTCVCWISLLLVLLHTGLFAKTSGYFSYSPAAVAVYQEIVKFEFEAANQQLARLRSTEPHNLVAYHLESYRDFLQTYFSESAEDYQRLQDARQDRLAHILSGDPNSPYFLFIQADMRLQLAIVRFKFEDYFSALLDVQKAWKLLAENQRRFPNFLPNIKDLATLQAILGTIPEPYRWGVKLLSGMEGSIAEGIQKLDLIAAKPFVFAKEVTLIRALLALHLEQQPEKAWQVISADPQFTPATNSLDRFFYATFALRSGKNDLAIQVLTAHPQSNFPHLYFLTGLAKMRRLDADAPQYFQQFLSKFRGRHFIKEAYQKLAWAAILGDSPQQYLMYMQQCLKRGYAVSGEDQDALQEAQSGKVPHPDLIKARLLFDGHYFRKAQDLLQLRTPEDFTHDDDKLEFRYRRARVWHGLGNYPEALKAYRETIETGSHNPTFYACNAALQAGRIYESLGQRTQAKEMYGICMQLNPTAHRHGLHQQAQAGLARLGQ